MHRKPAACMLACDDIDMMRVAAGISPVPVHGDPNQTDFFAADRLFQLQITGRMRVPAWRRRALEMTGGSTSKPSLHCSK